MRFIELFEKFKGVKRVYKHSTKGKEGISEISKKIEPKFKELKSPVKTLKNVMKELRDEMGLEENIEYLDSGMWGMAFKVGNKVIKLTSNREEVKVAKSLIGKKIPYIVNYYKVVPVKGYGIWAILMDLIKPLSKKEKSIFQIFEYCIDWEDVIKEIEESDYSKSYVKSLWEKYLELENGLDKSGIPKADMHSENIGWFDGNLVHFDIMPETGKDEISKLSGS